MYSSFELARNCLSELSLVVRDDTDLATLAEVLLRWMYATSAASAPLARTIRAVIPWLLSRNTKFCLTVSHMLT